MKQLDKDATLEDIRDAYQALDEAAKEHFAHAYNEVVDSIEAHKLSGDETDSIGEIFKEGKAYLQSLERIHNQKPMPVFESAPSPSEVEDYEMEFLIDSWMPADCLTILTGSGGIGKSYLSLQYITALAMGYDANTYALMPSNTKIPDKDKQDPIDIVIASYEEARIEVWKRIKRICHELQWPDYDTLSKRIHYVDLQGMGPAWGVATGDHLTLRSKMLPLGEYLLSESQRIGARLLVLDPSAAVYGGSEIARESVREFTSALNAWCRETECATLLIAHPPKSGDDYAGSTDWLGSCRAMWTLRQEERTEGSGQNKKIYKWYQLSNITKNYAPPQAPILLQKIKYKDAGYTPIWTPCEKQSEAEAFYTDYHQHWENWKPQSEEGTDHEKSNRPQF